MSPGRPAESRRHAGVGFNGTWFPLGTNHSGPDSDPHTFTIVRHDSDTWEFDIDGNARSDTVTWDVEGRNLQAGLESYASGATAPSHTYRSLSRRTNNGAGWVDWAGFDDTSVGMNMCGGWNTANEWRASENSSC
jgi:hypothetical protein